MSRSNFALSMLKDNSLMNENSYQQEERAEFGISSYLKIHVFSKMLQHLHTKHFL